MNAEMQNVREKWWCEIIQFCTEWKEMQRKTELVARLTKTADKKSV